MLQVRCWVISINVGKSTLPPDDAIEKRYKQFNELKRSLNALVDQCKNLVKNVNMWSETNRKLGKEMYTFVNTATSIESEIMKEYKESVVDLHDMFQTEYNETRRAITVILRARVISRNPEY